jgi:hypothetical protein
MSKTVNVHPTASDWKKAGVQVGATDRSGRFGVIRVDGCTIFTTEDVGISDLAFNLKRLADDLLRADDAYLRNLTMDQLAIAEATEDLAVDRSGL